MVWTACGMIGANVRPDLTHKLGLYTNCEGRLCLPTAISNWGLANQD
jgi:hypothetical protein